MRSSATSVLVGVALLLAVTVAEQKLYVFHEMFVWKHVDFVWAHDSDKARALDARLFQPEHCAVQALRVWRDALFVTLPRWRGGVPATLAWLPASRPQVAPPLRPFPSWEMQALGNCSALQSAQAVHVTPQGRLWVVDGGRAGTLDSGPVSDACPPKILIYDLDERNISASRLWKTLPVTPHVLSRAGDSSFADIAVDADDVAYISDASATEPGLVVVEARTGRAWKVRHESSMRADAFVPPPPEGLPGGVTALALASAPQGSVLYYAPLRSLQVFALEVSVLRDERVAMSPALDAHVRIVVANKTSPTQAMAVDSRGDNLYMGLNAIDSIARWDTAREQLQVLATDAERLQWPSGFALDDSGSLWVVSNRLRNFIRGAVSVDEPNYRIMKALVSAEGRPPSPIAPHETSSPDTFNVLDVAGTRSQFDYPAFNYSTHVNHSTHHDHSASTSRASVVPTVAAVVFVTALVNVWTTSML